MVYDSKWIRKFNKTKTKKLYEEVLNNIEPNHKKCRCCGGIIYYYDSTFKIDINSNISVYKKSYKSTKKLLNTTYNLTVCEDCLKEKFPEYDTLNKSRIFNRICDITNYAFNISEEVSNIWKSQNYSITLENLIIKYGEEDGTIKWDEYLIKQAESNMFEYKKEKHGWDKKTFDEYNKSRSVTKDNLISRHGEEKGIENWNKYVERQRFTCSLEYFIEQYGEEDGTIKYNNFVSNRENFWGYSEISQKIFNKIKEKLNKNYTYYYATNNYEYNVGSYLLDFYIKELDLAIEYNGDMWHGNPLIYNENSNPNPFDKNITAKEIWNKDASRTSFIKTKIKQLIIVWEYELKQKGIELFTDELVKEIEKYETKSKIKHIN